MRVPHSISKNVFEAYRCSNETIANRSDGRTIRAEDETWDELVVPELKTLALEVLVKIWSISPIIDEFQCDDDRDKLLEMLPTNLPFDLAIKKIPYEYYWCRAAQDRWKYNDASQHGNSWVRLYCERHFSEYLEHLENLESRKEECNALIKLVQPHIYTLIIRTLIPSKSAFKWSDNDNDEDQCASQDNIQVHHIPFNAILPQLPKLREIQLNFRMIYMNDGFEWCDFELSIEDCLNLGRAIKDSPRVVKVWITRSHFDQPRVAAFLQKILINDNIRELNFSHCKLGDKGAHAVGEFLKNHKKLKILCLINNNIGCSGVAGIVHGLLHEDSAAPLESLNLRLNPLRDAGGVHICSLLLRSSTLKNLNISSCCLGSETAIGIADVISSSFMKTSSLRLDISNNNFGVRAGEALEAAVKKSFVIMHLDSRMCNFSKETENVINETISRNKKKNLTDETMKSKSDLKLLKSSMMMMMNLKGVKSVLPPMGYEDYQKRHPIE